MNKAVTAPLPASVLEALARYDTPTICNAMEIVAPERRLIGYTTKPLVCPFPELPPMVGYARTVTIRSVLYLGGLPWGWKTYRDHERNAAAAQPPATAEAAGPSAPAATFSPAPDDAEDQRPTRLN